MTDYKAVWVDKGTWYEIKDEAHKQDKSIGKLLSEVWNDRKLHD